MRRAGKASRKHEMKFPVRTATPGLVKFHSRALDVLWIPASQIVAREIEKDSLFNKHWIRVLQGKAPLALTRIDESRVTAGFYRWEDGQAKFVIDPYEEDISDLKSMIRNGDRPAIYVYWSHICPKPEKFVCPDDINVLKAYRDLGFKKIPARIMGADQNFLDESAVLIRGEPSKFHAAMLKVRDSVETSFGIPSPPLSEVLSGLIENCSLVLDRVSNFDTNNGEKPHYHQFLRAALLRQRRLLESISILCDAGRADHAFALMRLAYEASINTYIDWLAPDWFGPRFQYLSMQRRFEAEARRKMVAPEPLRTLVDVATANFLESVEQKARLYPPGEYFYRLAYPTMSSTSHQDYQALTDSEIEQLMPEPYDIDRDGTLANWLDVICTPLLHRIADDVGDRV